MHFNTDIYHAEWLDGPGKWLVKCRQTSADGSVRDFDDYADILLNNCGIQNDWKWPDIEGLDVFKGKVSPLDLFVRCMTENGVLTVK
jgi:hydroxyversicolorone monooxygenase